MNCHFRTALSRSAAFALCAALLAASPTLAQDSARSDYEALVREGLALYEAGDAAEAYALFKRAHEVKPGPRPLRGMAIALFQLRRYVEAIDCAKRALAPADDGKPLTEVMRSELQTLIAKADRFVVHVTIATEPADARIAVDGRVLPAGAELVVDEGDYTIEVSHDDYLPRSITLRARIGQAPRLSVMLKPVAESEAEAAAVAAPPIERTAAMTEPSHVASWTLLGVGAAALAAGGVTGVLASSTFSDLDDRCPGVECTPELQSDVDTGRTLETLTNVLLITGGASVVAGLIVRFVVETPSETPPASGVAVLPACSVAWCGAVVQGRM